MENISFSQASAMISREQLEVNLAKIKILESENECHYRHLDNLIVNALIGINWKPYYNEKAIKIYLDSMTASYVWFVEYWNGEYSFKESPADFPYLKNRNRQDVTPIVAEDSPYHCWIIPLSLFQEINHVLTFRINPERHLTYNIR